MLICSGVFGAYTTQTHSAVVDLEGEGREACTIWLPLITKHQTVRFLNLWQVHLWYSVSYAANHITIILLIHTKYILFIPKCFQCPIKWSPMATSLPPAHWRIQRVQEVEGFNPSYWKFGHFFAYEYSSYSLNPKFMQENVCFSFWEPKSPRPTTETFPGSHWRTDGPLCLDFRAWPLIENS